MEQVIDKVIAELGTMVVTPASGGGIEDILPLKAIYFGDPGIIPASLYPCAVVEPDDSDPQGGTTAADKRDLVVEVSLLIDARDYFDSAVDEAGGDRLLVQSVAKLERWFSTRRNRTLDGTVHNCAVGRIRYRKRERGVVFAKEAGTTLHIRKSYPRTLD